MCRDCCWTELPLTLITQSRKVSIVKCEYRQQRVRIDVVIYTPGNFQNVTRKQGIIFFGYMHSNSPLFGGHKPILVHTEEKRRQIVLVLSQSPNFSRRLNWKSNTRIPILRVWILLARKHHLVAKVEFVFGQRRTVNHHLLFHMKA